MPTIPLFHRCPKCGRELPLTPDYFHMRKASWHGFAPICKECAREKTKLWRDKNIDHVKAREDEYRAAHREEAKRRAKRWYNDNIDYARDWHKQRYYRDKANGIKRRGKLDPIKSHRRQQRYVERHRDKRRASSLRYAHSVKGRVASRKRRAMQYLAEGSHIAADILARYALQEERCAYCGITLHGDYHVDHVIPLSRGGTNDPSNLALTCEGCNLSKGNKTPDEWMKVRGW